MKKFAYSFFIAVLTLLFFGCHTQVHSHTYSENFDADDEYHWHPSTCGHNDKVSGYEKHEWTDFISDGNATTTQDGTKTRTCTVCSAKTTMVDKGSKLHVHSFSSEWSYDEENHFYKATCEHDDIFDSYEAHEWDEGNISKTPTEEAEGVKTYTCKICSATRTETIAKLSHTHKFATTWSSDPACHWYAATCEHNEEKSSLNPHQWNNGDITKAATEEAEGEKTFTCSVCNFSKIEIIPVLSHSHTISSDWTFDEQFHWNAADCGKTDHIENKNGHQWNDGEITKTATEEAEGIKTYTCKTCSATRTEAITKLPHTHKYATTWSSDSIQHWHKATCEHTSEISKLGYHAWEPTSVNGSTGTFKCTTCGKTKTCSMFFETVEKVGTKTVNGKTLDIVTFGAWPQTIKASDVTINSSKTVTMGGNTYYLGSDNYYYIKVSENTAHDEKSYKYYSNGTEIGMGTNYFKVEPIRWYVLNKNYKNTGKALLHAEKALMAGIFYNENSTRRTVGTNTYAYGNNYQYSYVRAYLNGNNYTKSSGSSINNMQFYNKGFFHTAFTETAQNKIATTTVTNGPDSTTDYTKELPKADGTSGVSSTDYTSQNTSDKIFLLSLREATAPEYGFGSYSDTYSKSGRMRYATDYAASQGAFLYNYTSNSAWWMFRTPYYENDSNVYRAGADGGANCHNSVSNISLSICPALTIEYE